MSGPIDTLREIIAVSIPEGHQHDLAEQASAAVDAVEQLVEAARAVQADSFGDAPGWDALDAALTLFPPSPPRQENP